MGHRTLTWNLVFRALFMDRDAYDQLRDDDNPFVEGLFLLVLIGVATAALHLIGRAVMWASTPEIPAIQQTLLNALRLSPWWTQIAGSPEALAAFNAVWESVWSAAPFLGSSLTSAALNLIVWPLGLILSWLAYGLLAHVTCRMLGGMGSLNQTLGTLSLSFAPVLLRGLEVIPFLALGGVLSTWQLIGRYQSLRSAHGLTWGRALWATVLPLCLYALIWLVAAGVGTFFIAALARR